MELACKVRNRKVGLTVDGTHSGGPQKGVMYEPGLYKCRMQGSATSAPPAALTAPTNPNSAPKQGANAPQIRSVRPIWARASQSIACIATAPAIG